MLKQRTFTAIVLFLITGVILFIVPESYFMVFVLLVCLLAIYELTNMYQFAVIDQIGLMIVFVIFALLLCFARYDVSTIVRMMSVMMWSFIAPLVLIMQPKYLPKYVIGLLVFFIFAPAFYALVVLHGLLGAWQLISILAIAWISDIGAYFVGRGYGRHKLAPQISPGKSIEGAVAGLVCVMIYLLVLKYFHLAIYLYSYVAVFKFGLILVSAGIVGDLLESWLKRIVHVKDSGTMLPGHGGVFDRIDSLLPIMALSYAMIRGLI